MTPSSTGSIYIWNDFYPFEESVSWRNMFTAEPDARYKFTSKERDTKTGLYYFGARYYDSWRGQWLSGDPMGQGASPYAYCEDDPIGSVDPSGAYSYEINGMMVSNEVGLSLMDQTDIGQYQLEQQHREYQEWQEQSRVGQIIHTLSVADQTLLTALGASEASPNALYPKEIAGILFSVLNRLATGYGNARSISDVVYHKNAYDGVKEAIFFYALNGYITSNSNFGKEFMKEWVSKTYGPTKMLESYDARLARVRAVLSGIINGLIENPIGGSLFFHSTHSGTWDKEPFIDFLGHLYSIEEPPGFEFHVYGGSIFFNWSGLH